MKNIFLILSLLLSAHWAYAQEPFNGYQDGYDPDVSPFANDSTDRTPSDVVHERMTWRWMHNGVYRMFIPLDTTFDEIHNFNPIFKKSISNSYLANLPSSYESDIFIDRAREEYFLPLTRVRAYLFKPSDAIEFATTTPFTQLIYYSGGGKGKAENYLDAWHTQNINPFWNAGFRYNLISSDGRYMNQKSKAYNLSLFSSYEKERLAVSFFLNQNNGFIGENGGISRREDLNNSDIEPENIPTYLGEVKNVFRNFNFKTDVQYNIGNEKLITNSNDTTRIDTTYTYPFKAIFSTKVEDNVRRFKEDEINRDFYPVSYIDSNAHYNVTGMVSFEAGGKLVINEHPRYTYLPGIYAGLEFTHLNYKDISTESTDSLTLYLHNKYNNTWLTAGIFNVDTSALLNFDVNARISLLGDYLGDFDISGFIRQYLNRERSSFLHLDASLRLKSSNHFYDYFFGNHNIWNNDFSKVKKIDLKGMFVNTNLRTELGVGINNILDHIYMDEQITPQQTSKNLMILTGWAKQVFRLGNFWFDQRIYVQKSNHKDIMDLPLLSAYSHNYYSNKLFKEVLHFAIGFDLFYNTKFYADKYDPATMAFYLQREEKTGNYPKVDVFLDMVIKRATLFVKYEHLSYYITDKKSFTAVNYPINPPMLKFGVRWNFFD